MKLLSSPDGHVLIGSGKGHVRAREATTGEKLWEMSCGTADSFANRPVFSPDSKYLSLRCSERPLSIGQTYVVEAATGREVITFPSSAPSSNIGFSPDSRWMVTTCGDGAACVWEVNTWQKVAELRGQTAGVVTSLFSPDGKWLVI